MKLRDPIRRSRRSVLLIAPKAPPYGGMALQAELLAERMERDGVRVAFVASNPPIPAAMRLLGRIPVIRTLLRLLTFCLQTWLLMAETEVVHVFACSWVYFFVVVWPAVIFGRLWHKRVVMNYRGGEADSFLQRYGTLAKPAFRFADVVTAPSGFLANVLRAHTGVSVEIVPNIVDLAAFTYRERPNPAPKMVVTRHLEALYDTESILRAFGEVQARYPEASLSIAGTGTQEASLRALAADLKLRNVHFLGLVPRAKVPALYDRCDFLLNASKADNFPGSLVEAAAAGLVVISTGVGGIPYIFEDGESALLVELGDWRALAAGVLRVLTEPGLALRLTRTANQQCRRYDWEYVGPLLYAAYKFEPHPDSSFPSGESTAAEPHRDVLPGALRRRGAD
jgi:glycosyltransferase involved in cell wall biosynthesis